MVKYRLIYMTLLIASFFWFVFRNESVSFAILLACIAFPIVIKIWLIIECRMMHMKIAIRGELRINTPIQIRIASVSKHHACIGRVSGTAIIHHFILGQKEEYKLLLLESKNILLEDVVYQNKSCGVVSVSLDAMKAYDCFGLTSCRIRPVETITFTLLPNEDEDLQNTDASVPFGDEFIGIRKFREGDHLSGVHWKMSSKWDELYVKEFSDPKIPHISDDMILKCQMCTSRDLCYNE